MIDDAEIQALKKKQRIATLRKVGIAAAVIVAATAAVVPTGGSAVSMLEEKGHRSVDIERDGVFKFRFSSVHDGAKCNGTVTLLPGSTSQQQLCRSSSGRTELSETAPDGSESGLAIQ